MELERETSDSEHLIRMRFYYILFIFFLAAEVTEINQLKIELIGFLKMPRKSTHLKQNRFVFRHREGQESGIFGF